jgi:hypothetical protein
MILARVAATRNIKSVVYSKVEIAKILTKVIT